MLLPFCLSCEWRHLRNGLQVTRLPSPCALQIKPVGFTLHAVVTTSDLQLSPSAVDFGYCTIYEAIRTQVSLYNHSLLPQGFGFVGLPKVPRLVREGHRVWGQSQEALGVGQGGAAPGSGCPAPGGLSPPQPSCPPIPSSSPPSISPAFVSPSLACPSRTQDSFPSLPAWRCMIAKMGLRPGRPQFSLGRSTANPAIHLYTCRHVYKRTNIMHTLTCKCSYMC